MRYGPIIGAGAMISLACSWAALVMAPQLQLGALAPAPIPNTADFHPATRPGLAAQGAEVYRSLGCQQCHTRQLRQTAILFGARLNELGTNGVNLSVPGSGQTNVVNLDLLFALAKARPDLAINPVQIPTALAGDTNIAPKLDQFSKDLALFRRNDEKAGIVRPGTGPSVNELAGKLPADVLVKVSPEAAERAVKLLSEAGGKAELVIYNLGPDIERGWGSRRSVARDYVSDNPVLLGNVRVGPDLAGVSSRAPEKFAAPWKAATTNSAVEIEQRLLVHLYNPRLLAKDSICPSASYLFESKQPNARYSGQPLKLPGNDAPVYPKHNAYALVAYLLTQRGDIGLPEAPVPALAAKTSPVKP